MSAKPWTAANAVFVVVDIQNDFCTRGALAVPRGEEIVPVVNRLAGAFEHVILTQDWHPADHLSFAAAHAGKHPYDTVPVPYGEQVLWPRHCVQDTPGAAFYGGLHIPHAELILRKGYDRAIDSYSVIYENDRSTPTGLSGYLRERGLTHIYLAGLAFDFCVYYSAEDARREGFEVTIIEDACRGIDVGGSMAAARKGLAHYGIPCITSDSFARH